jgi:release factor glutamine methyltransferase
MPISRAPLTAAAVTARLRAAGCVFAEDEARLLIEAAETPSELATMLERRVGGLPLEHVIGWTEFCGLRIAVDEGVFVPRHRTEFLVEQALALGRPGAVVMDLCCGSGALGAVMAATIDPLELHATDLDPTAVSCARRNLASSAAHVYEGDLYAPLPAALRGRVDIVVANVPYVPTAELDLLPREARIYEPRAALDGGEDGLDVARRVAREAAAWLRPGGHLLVETTERQASRAADIFSRNGLVSRVERCEELEATVVIGTRPATASS